MFSVKFAEYDNNFEDLIDNSNANEGRRFGQSFKAACAQDPITHLRLSWQFEPLGSATMP